MKRGTTIGLGVGTLFLLGGGIAWALTRQRKKQKEAAATPAARAAARKAARLPTRKKTVLEKVVEAVVGPKEEEMDFEPLDVEEFEVERHGREGEISGASCYLAANRLNELADDMDSSGWAFWRSEEEHDVRNNAARSLRRAAKDTASHCSNKGFVPGPIQAKYNEAIMYAEADDPANVISADGAGTRGGTAGLWGFGGPYLSFGSADWRNT